MTIAITRLELSAVDLRDAARRTRDAKAARRIDTAPTYHAIPRECRTLLHPCRHRGLLFG